MITKILVALFILTTVLVSCTKEQDCADVPLQPAFIGFASSDIDTLVLRKFESNSSYLNLLDTFIITPGGSSPYQTTNDTTTVFLNDAANSGDFGIKVGFDWQIFIPSLSRTILISDIQSEKRTGKYSWGIFSMDKTGRCTNRIFSAKVNGQRINLADSLQYMVYIHS